MPRHKQVTTCRKSGGPVSKLCTCEHCTLSVCEVCGGAEGTLTTDCPGEKVAHDRHQEVFETNLDYTNDRGWHLAQADDGIPIRRSPRFESQFADVSSERHLPLLAAMAFIDPSARRSLYIHGCTCGWRTPPGTTNSDETHVAHVAMANVPDKPVLANEPRADPRTIVSPTTDWAQIDRTMDLQRELTQKAIAWVLADRICEDHSATLVRIEDEVTAHTKGQDPDARALELLGQLEHAKINFKIADQRAVQRDDEFRQLARRIVAELEKKAEAG